MLPVSPIKYPACYTKAKCDFISYGVGYDTVSDDYNVVRIAQFVGMNEVKIFSLKFNEWSKGEDFPYRLGCTTQGVFVKVRCIGR